MLPLNICFLWHQHQPDYRTSSGFFLPWVRMHAVKDYLDLPLILKEYPVRHTFNLVPSMLVQLEEYGRGRLDPVQRLSAIAPSNLTTAQRTELMRWARTVQRETMTDGLPRLRELMDMPHDGSHLNDQEALDLQVNLMLAWIGPVSRRHRPEVQAMMEQAENFTVIQRDILASHHADIMKKVVPAYLELEREGKIEISVTPFHHPILPLLCSTDDAREAMPDMSVPSPPFSYASDADWHVAAAIEYWESLAGKAPLGMWPAEGGVSMRALDVMQQHGIRWAATDEDVLKKSLAGSWDETSAFAPYRVPTTHGWISLLFRDHGLSDAIGFEYAGWEPHHAADDFLARLNERRMRIVARHGEQALERMVVPIILDGENCWEFYPGNGENFLRELMQRLSDERHFRSLTCSQAAALADRDDGRRLETVVAGSWIHGTFEIWIGTEVKNLAWSLLRDAREAISDAGEPQELVDLVRKLEASDWFWWYEDRHQAPFKEQFDVMFREHLSEIFQKLEIRPRVDLSLPLARSVMTDQDTTLTYPITYGSAAMHDADAIADTLTIETSGNWQRFSVHLRRSMQETEEVFITITDKYGSARRCGVVNGQVLFQSDRHDEGFDRQHERIVSVYLHAATYWKVDVEEQRSGGRSWLCSIDVNTSA